MAVAPVNGGADPATPAANAPSADAALQQAFATAIVKAGLFLLGSAVGDIAAACNDTTSDPDAVG